MDNWNKGDLYGYLQMYNPEMVLHGYMRVGAGLESVKKFYQRVWASFPGVQITIDDIIAEGDKLACRSTTMGINKGELMGIASTRKSVKFMGITIIKFKGGKCI